MNDNKISKIPLWAKFAVPISFLILFFLAANFTDCDLVTFWKRRNHLTDLVVDMIPPDFSYIQEDPAATFLYHSDVCYRNGTWHLLPLYSRLWRANLGFPAVIRRILRIVIQILRSFPALILALLLPFFSGLEPLQDTFAITLYTFAITTKLTYEDASAADVKSLPGTSGHGCFKVCGLYPWNFTRDHSWISHQCTLPVGN